MASIQVLHSCCYVQPNPTGLSSRGPKRSLAVSAKKVLDGAFHCVLFDAGLQGLSPWHVFFPSLLLLAVFEARAFCSFGLHWAVRLSARQNIEWQARRNRMNEVSKDFAVRTEFFLFWLRDVCRRVLKDQAKSVWLVESTQACLELCCRLSFARLPASEAQPFVLARSLGGAVVCLQKNTYSN